MVITGSGVATPIYSPNSTYNIWWGHTYSPYSFPGAGRSKAGHTVCLASNVTVNEICCNEQNGTFVDWTEAQNGTVTPKAPHNASFPDGVTRWCEITGPDYKDHYNTEPSSVATYRQCFDRIVVPAQNPGQYASNVTTMSVVYTCEGNGDFDGASTWGLPSLVATPSGAASPKAVLPVVGVLASVVACAVLGSFCE